MSFFLFLLSKVFYDILGGDSALSANLFIEYKLSTNTISEIFCLFSVSLASISFIVFKNMKRMKVLETSLKSNLVFKRTLFFIIVLSPFCFAKLWLDFQQVRSLGYLVLYTGLKPAPAILRVSWFLVQAAFPILFIIKPKKRTFFLLLSFFLILNMFDIFKGARGALLRPIAFFLWFYYKYYNFRGINLKKGFLIFIILIAISTTFMKLRGEKLDVYKSNLFELTSLFVSSQGVSFFVNAYYLDFKEEIPSPSKFYIFSPIVDFMQRMVNPKFRDGNSIYRVNKTLSIDDKITYAISPHLYEIGNGVGSSYIIELYALGGLMSVMFGSFLIGSLITKFENLSKYEPVMIIISWYWIQDLVWMPRGSPLFIIPSLLTTLLIYYLFKKI